MCGCLLFLLLRSFWLFRTFLSYLVRFSTCFSDHRSFVLFTLLQWTTCNWQSISFASFPYARSGCFDTFDGFVYTKTHYTLFFAVYFVSLALFFFVHQFGRVNVFVMPCNFFMHYIHTIERDSSILEHYDPMQRKLNVKEAKTNNSYYQYFGLGQR